MNLQKTRPFPLSLLDRVRAGWHNAWATTDETSARQFHEHSEFAAENGDHARAKNLRQKAVLYQDRATQHRLASFPRLEPDCTQSTKGRSR